MWGKTWGNAFPYAAALILGHLFAYLVYSTAAMMKTAKK